MPKRPRSPAPFSPVQLARQLASAFLALETVDEQARNWWQDRPGHDLPPSLDNKCERVFDNWTRAANAAIDDMERVFQVLQSDPQAHELDALALERLGAALTQLQMDVPAFSRPRGQDGQTWIRPVIVGLPVFADRRDLARLDATELAHLFQQSGMVQGDSAVSVLGLANPREMAHLCAQPWRLASWQQHAASCGVGLGDLGDVIEPLGRIRPDDAGRPHDVVSLGAHVIVVGIVSWSDDPDGAPLPAFDGPEEDEDDEPTHASQRIWQAWEEGLDAIATAAGADLGDTPEPESIVQASYKAMALEMTMPLMFLHAQSHPEGEITRLALAMDATHPDCLIVEGIFDNGQSQTFHADIALAGFLDQIRPRLPVEPDLMLADDLPAWRATWGHDPSAPRPRRIH